MAYPRTHQAAPQPYRGNTPPVSTAPALAPSDQMAAILRFLGMITDGQRGWLEVSWIEGDPTPKMGGIFHQQWMRHRDQADAAKIARRCLALGATYGNVYVSSALYHKPDRHAPQLPNRLVFLDDAPVAPALPYSAAVQTSASSRHAYYLTAERLTTDERVDLQGRAAYALGSDKSGADAQQIVRVPGTFNTKAGGRYPVHIAHEGGPIYTAAELAAAWPPLPARPAGAAAIDDQAVRYWLGNSALLVSSEGIPHRIKSEEIRRRIWRECWPDTSAQRYARTKSLIMHGYPDAEIAAILYRVDAGGRKGAAWLTADIERCIKDLREVQDCAPRHGIRPTRTGTGYQPQLPAPIPSYAPTRKGRPVRLTAAALLARYRQLSDDGAIVLMSRREAAAAAGVSTATIDRLERELTDAGKMHRVTSDDRRFSWVRFGAKVATGGVIKNPPAASAHACEVLSEMADPAESADANSAPEWEKPNDIGVKEHTAPLAPLGATARRQPACSAAAVAAGACVPPSPDPDALLAGDHGSADDWASLAALAPPAEDADGPPADATEQLTALDAAAPPPPAPTNQQIVVRPRRRIETAADLAPAVETVSRPRLNEAAYKVRVAAFDGEGTMQRLRARWAMPATQHNHKTPPPPAASAAPPVAPGLPDGIDWAAARAAWDACRIGKFCEDHDLDREAVIDHLISAVLAA